jgi:PadR family transcriptional regulator, regulatory protein PadR
MAKKPKTKRLVLLGPIEVLVIKAVLALEENAYGISVFERIRTVYHSMAFGSVYTALERLTWKGHLEGRMGDPEPMRGGRAKKYYRVTDSGLTALKDTLDTMNAKMPKGEFAMAISESEV